MQEFKVQINVRVNNDMNMSTSMSHIVDDGTDVEALGLNDASLIKRYMDGFGTYDFADDQ